MKVIKESWITKKYKRKVQKYKGISKQNISTNNQIIIYYSITPTTPTNTPTPTTPTTPTTIQLSYTYSLCYTDT